MRNAQAGQQGGSPEQSAAGQRRAAERLNEAKDMLGGMRQQESAKAMEDMVLQAEQLAAHQQDFQNRLRQQASGEGSREPSASRGERKRWPSDLKSLERQMSDTAKANASRSFDQVARGTGRKPTRTRLA